MPAYLWERTNVKQSNKKFFPFLCKVIKSIFLTINVSYLTRKGGCRRNDSRAEVAVVGVAKADRDSVWFKAVVVVIVVVSIVIAVVIFVVIVVAVVVVVVVVIIIVIVVVIVVIIVVVVWKEVDGVQRRTRVVRHWNRIGQKIGKPRNAASNDIWGEKIF
jgi:ABC-type multidrug transport system fused ATPase/permease subunit